MIQFPISDCAMFAVIEPGNLKRLKQGKPLTVTLPNGSSVMIAFTPDANAFLERLGVAARMPEGEERGGMTPFAVHITAEQLDATLKTCQDLPEVDR